MAVAYLPLSPAFTEDPYPSYTELRDQEPVHFDPHLGVYVLSRYDDVVWALRDHGTFSSQSRISGRMAEGPLRFLIFSDPPDHTKLRRLVSKPFAPAAIARLEPRIRQICEELVDGLIAANEEGRADLVEDLAYPLPVTVIAEMMGIPAERRDDFKRWSDDFIGGTSPDFSPAGAAQSTMEVFAFFTEVVEQRRSKPGDDLVSALVSGPEPLNTTELILFCLLLLVAGNETTTNLIGNGAAALFAHPDEARKLCDDPSLVRVAVEEALRYDAPVQAFGRTATADVERHGVTIPAGAAVMVLYGSANRDPRHFDEPDRFLLDRKSADHVAFGAGIHFCLGAALARLETRVAAETLLRRTRAMHQQGDADRVSNIIVRGLRRLPVAFEPA